MPAGHGRGPVPASQSSGMQEPQRAEGLGPSWVIWKEASRTKVPLSPHELGEERASFLSWPPLLGDGREKRSFVPAFHPLPTSGATLGRALHTSPLLPPVWVMSWGTFLNRRKGRGTVLPLPPPSNFLHLTCYKMSHIKKLYMGEVYPTSVKTLQIIPPSLSLFKKLLLRTEL